MEKFRTKKYPDQGSSLSNQAMSTKESHDFPQLLAQVSPMPQVQPVVSQPIMSQLTATQPVQGIPQMPQQTIFIPQINNNNQQQKVFDISLLVWPSVSLSLSLSLFVYLFVWCFYCVCVCVCVFFFFYTSMKSWRVYIFTAVCLCVHVCLSVCLSVCPTLHVNKIPAEQIIRFGRNFC